MAKCQDCGKELQESDCTYCDSCGVCLCEECLIEGFCSVCTELWVDDIDFEDVEAEEEA